MHAAGHAGHTGQRVVVAFVANVLYQRGAHLQRMVVRDAIVAANAIVAAIAMVTVRHGLRRALTSAQARNCEECINYKLVNKWNIYESSQRGD